MVNKARGLSKADIERLLPEMSERFFLLGRGPIGERSGFGAVWKALDPRLEREVAVKISHVDLSDEIVMCRDGTNFRLLPRGG